MSIIYKRASSDGELRQILILQKENSLSSISLEESKKEGFITLSHSFELLKQMNDACPHIIAIDGDLVVGYALVMLPTFKNKIPVLIPMFETVDSLLQTKRHIAMGQVCVSKSYRKKGIFRGMYRYFKEELKNEYDGLITEVATSNQRSLNAHKSVGFEILKTQIIDRVSWELIYWKWI